jgi:hypothetical protein
VIPIPDASIPDSDIVTAAPTFAVVIVAVVVTIEVTPTAPLESLLIIVPSFGNVKVLLPDAATGAISV